jgi:hypothetical protein
MKKVYFTIIIILVVLCSGQIFTQSASAAQTSTNKIISAAKITKKVSVVKKKIVKKTASKTTVKNSIVSNVKWTAGALKQLRRIYSSTIRTAVKKKYTNYAKTHGIKVITEKIYLSIHI